MKKLEIILRNFILQLLLLFKKQQNNSALPTFDADSKILFIRLNRIGDALVTTPLFHQLKEKLNCTIFVLADTKNHFIFENCPNVDKTIVYEKGLNGIKQVNNFIKENNIFTIVDLHDDVSVTVSFLIALSKTKFKFGLKKSNNKIYTHTIDRLDAAKYHVVERNLELIKLFGFLPDYSIAKTSYRIKDSSLETAEKIIHKSNDEFIVGINITAGSDARFWGVENFKNLVQLLIERNIKYIVFTTEDKFTDALLICDKINIYPPDKDFDIFAAGISKVNLLFTSDTSVMHIASMLNIPVFGLYVKYKTEDMIWSPYKTEFDCIITEQPTLNNVTFSEVKNKFIPFLEKKINAE
jgi:ADP-heptose:LPS heptosyltransferase